MMEKVILLGTSAGMPTHTRNVASLALVFSNPSHFWLFDCGEGTQQQIERAGLKLARLKNIFISHLHGDHIFGLPGLLATRGLQGNRASIHIFGPIGLQSYLDHCFHYSKTYIPYSYHVYSLQKENYLSKKLLWRDGNCSVYSAILEHQMDSFGYSIVQERIKRNIIVEKLLKLGIKPGPIYQKIKEEKQITLEDGRTIKRKDFVIESVDCKKFCYCSDTMFSKNAVTLSRNADLLVHEATFSSKEKFEAEQSFHSTVEDAARVASSANVKRLVLTHISPRYQKSVKNSNKWGKFKEEIDKLYPKIILAEDFLEIKI